MPSLLPIDLQTLIFGANSDDGCVFVGSKAQVKRLLSAGLVRHWPGSGSDEVNPYRTFEITDKGQQQVRDHAYRCPGCADYTMGTVSAKEKYDCCVDCIQRVTEMKMPDDDDPGPFRPRRVADPRTLRSHGERRRRKSA
jgi:hypothetical protein